MRFRLSICIMELLFSLVVIGHAQVTTGTISGSITDSTGAVLPAAKIVIQNADTGIARTVQTDASGHYSAPSLSLGNYQVTVSMEGFQTEVRKGIVLTIGREAVVNVQLPVGAVTQTVEVAGEAPLVQTTESTVSYQVVGRTINDLPLNGRDMVQLIVLQPGITQISFGSNSSATDGYSKRISISGLRGEYNSYLLDGSYIVDFKHHIPAGPSGALLGVETVREFQVLTNSYSAQYGRSLGGVFNAVSKSGTNEWHGDVYEFLRNSALDARNFFDRKAFPNDPRLPPFRRNQFGGTLGGPIRKDKTFFFAAYEALRQSLGGTYIRNVPDANAHLGILPSGAVAVSPKIAPFLALFPLPSATGRNFGDGTAQFIFGASVPTTDDFSQGRIDHQFSESDSFFVRYTNSRSFQSIMGTFPGHRDNSFVNSQLLTLSETHLFSARLLNSARFAFNRIDPGFISVRPEVPPEARSVPGQPFAPVLSPGSGLDTMGNNTDKNRFLTNRFSFQDDVNLTLRSHSLTFGGMMERLQFNQTQPDRPMGQWSFSNLTDFLRAIPSQYRGTPVLLGNPTTGVRQRFFGLYLQDDWRVRPSLTLNMGLRWDPYTVPTEVNGNIANLRNVNDPTTTVGDPYWVNKSLRDFGPRIGFAWSPFAKGKTAVRAAFGRFFMPIDSLTVQTRLARIYPFFPNLIFANPTHFPDAIAEINAQTQTSFGVAQALNYDGMKTSRALQYNLNIQQQLGANTVLIVGYNGSRGTHAMAVGDYEMPVPQYDGLSLAIPATATVRNPAFSGIVLTTMNGNSRYNGLVASFQRRFSEGLQAQVSYTYSKAISNSDTDQVTNSVGGGGGGYAKNPYDMRVQKALSGYDLRNVLSVNYSYDLPLGRAMRGVAGHLLSGWQWTGIVKVQNGQPLWVFAAVPTPLVGLNVQSRSPNLLPGFTRDQIVKGGPDQYFNPLAYTVPGPRELGNVGRNTLAGPGLATLDMGLTKNSSLTEHLRLQFRAEFFNILNRVNFGAPATSVFTSTGAKVGSVGVITSEIGTSRQIQFGLKLAF